jgi:hypothetical protein
MHFGRRQRRKMRETSINDIERINIILLVLGSMASAIIMRNYLHFMSFAVGSAIVVLNFRFLRRIIESLFAEEIVDKKSFLVRLFIKFLCMAVLVAVVFIWGNVKILFFVLGLSTVFASILVNQVIVTFTPAVRRNHNGT